MYEEGQLNIGRLNFEQLMNNFNINLNINSLKNNSQKTT